MVSSKMLAVALALCVATAAAIDTTSVTLSSATFKVLETSEAGQGWRSIGAANPASTIKVTIAPKRVRVNDVLAFADMVSDPSSTMYTKYVRHVAAVGGFCPLTVCTCARTHPAATRPPPSLLRRLFPPTTPWPPLPCGSMTCHTA